MLVLRLTSSLFLLAVGFGLASSDVVGVQADSLTNAASILLRDEEEVWEHSHLDGLVALSETTGDVLDAVGPLSVVEDLVEEVGTSAEFTVIFALINSL